MNTGADLHLHTTCSDGLYTPEKIVAAARAAKLRAIAVTDHDSVESLPRLIAAASAESDLEIVPGVELSVQAGMDEIHIVGLFIRAESAELTDALRRYRRQRVERIHEICRRLTELEVAISPNDVLREAGAGAPGRVHVARVLKDHGRVRAIGEAFDRYIGNHAPCYVPKSRPPAEACVALIHSAGGIAVMAHPGLTNRDDLIPQLAGARLDAIEILAPAHDSARVAHYRELARKHKLLESAGSDFHGDIRETITVGCVRLPDTQLELLRERAENPR